MRKLKAGGYFNPKLIQQIIEEESDTQVITASSTVVNKAKGIVLLNGSGALTGLTLPAPTKDDIGREIQFINIAAQTAALAVTGMAFAAQDAFAFAAASATVIGPALVLKCVDTTPTGVARTAKWVVKSGAGFVAGTSAVT
jgi:hypothetical protein